MMQWINVKQLKRLGLDENKGLGIMRIDWCGSYSEICNQWFPSQNYLSIIQNHHICIETLKQQLNDLMFNELNIFEKVMERCQGEGYQYEETFKVEGDEFDFFIRLKPVRDECSHIFVYIK
ncbi:hypothetical protein HMPREF9402_2874 [Turicibacter sp. HGF1]|uniref:hypothetical protein n=1 Tax=Turicibacter sp. HGF1 TaxID=910310 RepID=UPI0001FD7FF6|nr:hypothetical protein [Turicibacter sp. HGF1]EGC92670.1 hypothetical protein HMPREF9402_2874 [Turicibacter sp. HGF1]